MPPVQEAGGGEAEVLEHVDAGVLERGVVERRDVPEPHRADVGDDARRRDGRTARARARCGGCGGSRAAGSTSSGRAMSRIGTRSASSRCWTMCATASCSPSASIGETSATNRHSSPAPQAAARQPLAAARAALGARAAPAQPVDDAVAGERDEHARGEGPRGLDGHAHTIVTRACCSGARARARLREHARPAALDPRAARPARSAARPLRDGGAVVCAGCLRRLPWLRGHRCPRCALPRHRAGLPGGARRLRPRVVAAGLRGRGARPRAALKFRAALPVAGLMAAQLAANLPADLRAAAARRRARPAPTAAAAGGAGSTRRRCSPPRSAGRTGCRCAVPAAAWTAGARQVGRRAGAAAQRRALRGGAVARRRARRCSSTTSTRPARRSTPARGR